MSHSGHKDTQWTYVCLPKPKKKAQLLDTRATRRKITQMATCDRAATPYNVNNHVFALCKKWVNNRLRDTNWLSTSCLIIFVLLLKSKQTVKAGRSESQPGIGSKCSVSPKSDGALQFCLHRERRRFQIRHTD